MLFFNSTYPNQPTNPIADNNNDQGSQPQPPLCSLVRVDFHGLRVTDDSDRGNGDWTLVLEANGNQEIKEYDEDAIDDGTDIPYDIGVSINVPIDEFTTELKVKVSGFERDGGLNGENDPLAIAQRSWSRQENFGIGQTYDVAATNNNSAYAVTVSISCAQRSTIVQSRAELVQASTWRLEREIIKMKKMKRSIIELSEARAINMSIATLESRGWRLKTVGGDLFIFEGMGKIPSLRMIDPRDKSTS